MSAAMAASAGKRRLVAAYACRAGGTRLYGKPLQNLEPGTTILDHILACTRLTPQIDEIVLGISEGIENEPFVAAAQRHGLAYIRGSEKDVLRRLIQCGRAGAATDVFRITTECPFTAWELVADAWRRHTAHGNDITVTDWMPEGINFEIYTMAALDRSHAEGEDKERSEYCSAYARRRHDLFRIEIVEPTPAWRRLDLRYTVDFPEDLILCREAYRALKAKGPQIPVGDLVRFADEHPALHGLVAPFVHPETTWASAINSKAKA